MRRLGILIGVTMLATGSACQPPKPGPEQVLEQFLTDLQYRRSERAWRALSEDSQRRLRERHQALREAAGNDPSVEASPAELLYLTLDAMVIGVPESIVVVSPLGDVVQLRVSLEAGRSAEIRMVRESSRWRIDLLRSMEPARTKTAAVPSTAPTGFEDPGETANY